MLYAYPTLQVLSTASDRVGPLIAFGFLLIPALTSHQFARTMRQFTITAAVIGGLSSFSGFWIAYEYNLPVGPTDVVVLGIVYCLAIVAHRLRMAIKVARGSTAK